MPSAQEFHIIWHESRRKIKHQAKVTSNGQSSFKWRLKLNRIWWGRPCLAVLDILCLKGSVKWRQVVASDRKDSHCREQAEEYVNQPNGGIARCKLIADATEPGACERSYLVQHIHDSKQGRHDRGAKNAVDNTYNRRKCWDACRSQHENHAKYDNRPKRQQ